MATTNLSPQSEAVIQRLLAGMVAVSGNLTIGPLSAATKQLLTVLVQQNTELTRAKGEEQARMLRRLYSTAVAAIPTAEIAHQPQSKIACCIGASPPAWSLLGLRCRSIRGIAPAGEVFDFTFHGQSNLIYGPNGSGKSSLLGAVTWIITGKTIIDSSDAKDDAPLYKPATGGKLREWPIIATLPSGPDVTKVTPDCWGELLLQRADDDLQMHLRRQHGAALEASLDGQTWISVVELAHFGIEPLDVQLSLLAPTIFGRRAVEEADDTRNILSLMLGFEDLEQLGSLSSTMSGNRTRLYNNEKSTIESKELALMESIRLLPAQLPDGTAEHTAVSALGRVRDPTIAAVDSTKKLLDEAAATAEKQLAEVLGLAMNDGKPPAGLADSLTVAVDHLGKGFDAVFPSLVGIRLATVLPVEGDDTPPNRLVRLSDALESLIADTKNAIARRYEWWCKESVPGSKAALLLKAATHFHPETGECPVCDRPIDDPDLKARLRSLKGADAALSAELRTFFADLTTQLSKLVPEAVTNIASMAIVSRVDNDWMKIKENILGASFAALTAKIEPLIEAVKKQITSPSASALDVLPPECDSAFSVAAQSYCAVVGNARQAISILQWSNSNWDAVRESLETVITKSADTDSSLLAQLSKGKGAAALVKPLMLISRELAKSRTLKEASDKERKQLTILELLEAPLDQLKQLAKYAESAVRSEFDSIKDNTVAHLKKLYPESSTGMQAGKLKLGTGKDKSVEALLTSPEFEVAGQYFANAGLQRAVALAFYFALLEKHRGGLGFIIMDDPILSLDEDHRERWSAHVLKPKLSTLQIILATHQRQFLNNCAQDFAEERCVELNPRDRKRRISWKPGDRLKRAAYQLREQGEWLSAATTMRKYREDVLISLDAYSPDAFFDFHNLADSWKRYEKLPSHNPLCCEFQKKLCDKFRLDTVGRVLDPASHSLTEANVTNAMVEDCLKELEGINMRVVNELTRLDRLRERSLRGSAIEGTLIPFPSLNQRMSWAKAIELPLVGAVAAKTGRWSVEFTDETGQVSFQPGSAVQVCSESFEPVAYPGQWVLLADEATTINDGDLVAVQDENESRLLRRVWSMGRMWVLQSINPIRPTSSVTIAKRLAGIRKVIGILYHPPGTAAPKSGQLTEWLPCASLDVGKALASCRAIDVRGASLSPIARHNQKILVGEPLVNLIDCPSGGLAVVEFTDAGIGAVVKQVFPGKKEWSLVSPNSVDRIAPIVVSPKEIRAVWLLNGVLFEVAEV